jgi:hypothetical protein
MTDIEERGRTGPPRGGKSVGTPAELSGQAGCSRHCAAAASRSHRDYARWRARQIAYGRWRPWAEVTAVREHVRTLKQAGGSDRAIAQAAGVSTATVHRLQHGRAPGCPEARSRVSVVVGGRLLAVTPAAVKTAAARRDAVGARRRLRALTAMGHPGVSLAAYLGVPAATIWNLLSGRTATVSPSLDTAVRRLYERTWNLTPPERTGAERRAVAAARARAAECGWPAPMGLDDDRIDDPAYQPHSRWRPASGTGVADAAVRTLQAGVYRLDDGRASRSASVLRPERSGEPARAPGDQRSGPEGGAASDAG